MSSLSLAFNPCGTILNKKTTASRGEEIMEQRDDEKEEDERRERKRKEKSREDKSHLQILGVEGRGQI